MCPWLPAARTGLLGRNSPAHFANGVGEAARVALEFHEQLYASWKTLNVEVLNWSKRSLDSEMALATRQKERVAAWERHWLFLKRVEADTALHVKEGTRSRDLICLVTYFRLEVEFDYLKEKAKIGKSP